MMEIFHKFWKFYKNKKNSPHLRYLLSGCWNFPLLLLLYIWLFFSFTPQKFPFQSSIPKYINSDSHWPSSLPIVFVSIYYLTYRFIATIYLLHTSFSYFTKRNQTLNLNRYFTRNKKNATYYHKVCSNENSNENFLKHTHNSINDLSDISITWLYRPYRSMNSNTIGWWWWWLHHEM